jgi:uncharacterized membrane protein YphA (DoxX/SURF4 family)
MQEQDMSLFNNLLYIAARIIVSLLLILMGIGTLLPGIIIGSNIGYHPMSVGVSELLHYPIGFVFLFAGLQMLIGLHARGMASIAAMLLGGNFFLFDTASIQQIALFGTLLLFVANGSGKYSLIKSHPLFEDNNIKNGV